MFRFTKGLIQLRKRHPCLMQRQFLSGAKSDVSGMPDISWYGLQLNQPSWTDPSSRVLACTLSRVEVQEEDLHIIFNMSDDDLSMELPVQKRRAWYLAVDISLSMSQDIIEPEQQQLIRKNVIRVSRQCIVVCESRFI